MKQKILLFIGLLIPLLGYTKEVQIKTIGNKSLPLTFVKVSSGGICLGFTDESGILMFDNSSIIDKKILFEKSTYHPKEVVIEDGKDNFIFNLEILKNSTVPDYSIEEIYSLIDQVLKTSKDISPNKKLEGLVFYLLEFSQNVNPILKEEVLIQFLLKPNKIKILGKIDKSIRVWLISILKAEPVRNRIYKSLYENTDYSYSVGSSYTNEIGDIILVIDIVNQNQNDELIHTQLVINDNKKLILEFHNSIKGKNGNAIPEPEYHAIYSVNDGLLYTDYLSAKYIYQKNGETDTRYIKVLF